MPVMNRGLLPIANAPHSGPQAETAFRLVAIPPETNALPGSGVRRASFGSVAGIAWPILDALPFPSVAGLMPHLHRFGIP
jgi:hypothetical protein